MIGFTKWFGTTMAIALLATTVGAAETVSSGKVKSIDDTNKTFVIKDSAGKEFTFKLGDKVVMNRSGKESNVEPKSGDTVYICYDKGVSTWTAHYILIAEGSAKNCELVRGTIKGYDADTKVLTFTNEFKKDLILPIGKATVRTNMEATKIEDAKAGDHALLVLDTVDGKPVLEGVMIDRK